MIRRRAIQPRIETLEDRNVPALNPSGLEQELLEQVNRMRLNPGAELSVLVDSTNPIHSADPAINSALQFFHVNGTALLNQWKQLKPAQPLAWNANIMAAALGHSQKMIQQDMQEHQLPGEPDVGVRLTNAGYNWNTLAESIFAYGETPFQAHAALAIDWGFTATGIQDPPGHRQNLMNPAYRETGISIIEENNAKTGVGPLVITQDFGNRANIGNPYLLGVVYVDRDKDGRYDNQEGMGNVNITIDGVNDFKTVSMSAGGYQIQVPAGAYTITFSGGGIPTPIVKTVTVGGQNVKIDAKLTPSDGPNHAPVLSTKVAPVFPSINEDTLNPTGTTIAALLGSLTTDADFGANKGAAIISLAGTDSGTWEFSLDAGAHWASMAGVSANNAGLLRDIDKIRFRPKANFQGTATLQLRAWDRTTGMPADTVDLSEPTAIGGSTAFSEALATASITVLPVNDPPQGKDKTATIGEDKAYAFMATDFELTDPIDSIPNALSGVIVTSLPTKGTLTLAGKAVVVNQAINLGDITLGKFLFTPAANAFGTPYATFGFKVRDDGGTKNGGIDLDPTPNVFTFAVQALNDPPDGANKTITINEDIFYPLTVADFGFKDAKDTPANGFLSVRIESLPAKGSLLLSGAPVTIGQEITTGDLTKGLLKFVPALNGNGAIYTNFTFKVRDTGGTENGGIDLDPTANTIAFSVKAVNDAPDGTDKTITMLEDASRVLTTSDFGFKDLNDTPANALASVTVTSLPTKGVLRFAGVAAKANQVIQAADIVAGKLVYGPAKNESGLIYGSFAFKVADNGGTALGGVALDPFANTLSFSVTAVNDPPQGANKSVSIPKNTALVLTLEYFSFTDINDSPANLFSGVQIVALPLKGSLTLNGIAVKANTFITAADIAAGKLKFTLAVNATGKPYASFTFKVGDDGDTANGGANLDPVARSFAITVT